MIGDALLAKTPEARSCTVILTSRSLRPLSESSVRPTASHSAARLDMHPLQHFDPARLLACPAAETTERGTSLMASTKLQHHHRHHHHHHGTLTCSQPRTDCTLPPAARHLYAHLPITEPAPPLQHIFKL